MVEHQVVSLGAPHRQLPAKVGHTLHAEIDVVDLELLHVRVSDYTGLD